MVLRTDDDVAFPPAPVPRRCDEHRQTELHSYLVESGPLVTYLLVAVLVGLGVAGVVLGEGDDSPGLQGLGVLLVLAAAVIAVRRVNSKRRA